jgi:predicted nuclease of predicted toxin-antitoxin system
VRLLADECVDARILAALEEAGHEVECPPLPLGVVDLDVAAAAETLNLPLLAQDLDFGELGSSMGARARGW